MYMKNNKGATLIELIVSMAVLAILLAELSQVIMTSSKLYLNGTYEVDLQAEAQNIILQMEDMIVDARIGVSSNYNSSLSSDDLIIVSTNDISSNVVGQEIKYEVILSPSENGKDYGKLYLRISEGGVTSDQILMSDYVKSVSLDFANFETDNMLTLNVSMKNDRYSYTTSKDIFLRNMLGTGPKKRGKDAGAENMAVVDILRFGDYNLKDECVEYITAYEAINGAPDSYEFVWNDTSISDISTFADNIDKIYKLSSSGSLVCGSELLSHFNWNVGGLASNQFVVDCFAKTGSKKVKVCGVQLGTVPVSVGLGRTYTNTHSPCGFGTLYAQVAYSEPLVCCVPVAGIALKNIKNIEIKCYAKAQGVSQLLETKTATSFPIAQISHGFGNAPELGFSGAPGTFYFGKWDIDEPHNALTVGVDRSFSGASGHISDWISATKNKKLRFCADVVIKLEQDSHTEYLKFSVYYLPNDKSMTDDAINNLINNAKND